MKTNVFKSNKKDDEEKWGLYLEQYIDVVLNEYIWKI